MISGGYVFSFYKICHHRSLIFQISRSVDFLSDGCKRFAISFPPDFFPAKLPSPISMKAPIFVQNNHHEDPTNFLWFLEFSIIFPPKKNRANHAIQRSATSQKHWPLNKSLVDPRPARIHPPGEVRRFLDGEMGYTSKKKIEKNKEYIGEIMNEPYSYDMMF